MSGDAGPRRAKLRLALAVCASVPFLAFTAWWLADGGTSLDAAMVRFTNRLLQGALDVVVSDSWPIGEPETGVMVIGAIAAWLAWRRRFRAALLVAGGFLVLSGVQVAMVLSQAVARHVSFDLNALSHLYPSGHTARVPYIGTSLAMLAPRRIRSYVFATTAVVAVALALDRTDSTIQSGSAVLGGVLLGIAVSAWLVFIYSTHLHDA